MWKTSLHFLEPNLSGIGGLHLVPTCERIVADVVLPALREQDPALRLELGHDVRNLLMQEVLDHLEVLGRYSRQLFRNGSSRAILLLARREHGAVISESFSRHFGVQAGDTIPIDTPTGTRSLPIVGVFYDYSTDQGAILMDHELYLRWFHDPVINSMAIYLKPGRDAAAARAAFIRRLGSRYALVVTPNRGLRQRAAARCWTSAATWSIRRCTCSGRWRASTPS